ncbi:unnamed protein product [Peniophora sp. CBMAI 1063]|nr:unnamed protein product [Peniophora sp. CBMAI 1063]
MSIDSDVPAGDEQVALVAFAPDVDPVEESDSASTTKTHSIVLCEDQVPDAVTAFVTAVRALHFRATNIEDAGVVIATSEGSLRLAQAHVNNDTTLAQLSQQLRATNEAYSGQLKAIQTAISTLTPTTRLSLGGVDLLWALERDEEAVRCDITYNTQKFTPGYIQLLAVNVGAAFDAVHKEPTLPIADVHFPNSLRQLSASNVPSVVSLQKGPTSFPHTTIPGAFSDAVSRHAERLAIVTTSSLLESEYTYKQLHILSSSMAQVIRRSIPQSASITAPVFVAFCIPPSPLALITILAILKTGAAYVPLDIRLPDDRLRTLIADSGSCVLVTTADAPQVHLPPSVAKLDVSDFLVDRAARELTGATLTSADYHVCPATPTSPAYVMYTSGSTGLPKGVCVAHASVLALADPVSRGAPHNFPVGPTHRVAQLNNLAWDGSVFDVFCTFLTGATLVSLDRYAVLDPEQLAEAFTTSGVTTSFITTSLFRTLLRTTPETFARMHTLLVGGESIDYDVYREIFRVNPGLALWNMYGPTETCCYTTAYRVPSLLPTQKGAQGKRGLVPIGKPLDHTLCCVVDRQGRLVPPGVVGELWIGGVGVALEYLARPKETATAFIEHEVELFERNAGDGSTAVRRQRFYRTGDLVKWLPDGQMQFEGRVTSGQVKIRGQRLELAEVEAAIVRTGLVADAAVLHVKPEVGEPHLSAYIVPDKTLGSAALSEAMVKTSLKKSIPAHMIPQRFTILSALPLTNSGKCDRRMLHAIDAKSLSEQAKQLTNAERGTTQPAELKLGGILSGDTISALCAIFEDVLCHNSATSVAIGPDSNFFDIGGHSLLAMKLKWRVETALASERRPPITVSLTIRDIFENPTPRQLANFVDAMGASTHSTENDAWPYGVDLGEGQSMHPLSIGQLRVWQMVLTDNDPTAHCPHWFRFDGPLDQHRLRLAMKQVFDRHEILRSVFVPDAGVAGFHGPAMRVLPEWCPELEVIDVPTDVAARALGADAFDWSVHSEGALGDLLRFHGNRLFALPDGETGCRLVLFRLSEQVHVLLLSMNHIITDGYSRATHFHEIGAFYKDPRPQALVPLPLQYGSFARWQRSEPFARVIEPKLKYWTSLIESTTALEFAATHPRTKDHEPSREGALRVLACTPDLVSRLEHVCRVEHCSMFVVVVAALRLAHDRLSGGRTRGATMTPTFGATAANRTLSAFADSVGYFVNIHLYPIKINEDDGVFDVLRRVRGMAWDALANEEAPFPMYAAESAARTGRDLRADPLLRLALGYHQFDDAPIRVSSEGEDGLELRLIDIDMRLMRFDLQVFFNRHADGSMHGDFHYRKAMFDDQAIDEIVQTYEQVLEELATLA